MQDRRRAWTPPVEEGNGLQRAHDIGLRVVVEQIARALVVRRRTVVWHYRRPNMASHHGERVDEQRRLRQLVDIEVIAVEDRTPGQAVFQICLDKALLQVWAGQQTHFRRPLG